MRAADDGRITIGGRATGRRDAGRRAAGFRALAAVLALGAGAGGGAVVGFVVAAGWWLARADGPAGAGGSGGSGGSVGGVLVAGAVGVVLGALVGLALAGGVVAVLAALRRRPGPETAARGVEPVEDRGEDQSRSS